MVGEHGLKQAVCIQLVETLQEIISGEPSLGTQFPENRSLGILNYAWVIRFILEGAEPSSPDVRHHHDLAVQFLQKPDTKRRYL